MQRSGHGVITYKSNNFLGYYQNMILENLKVSDLTFTFGIQNPELECRVIRMEIVPTSCGYSLTFGHCGAECQMADKLKLHFFFNK